MNTDYNYRGYCTLVLLLLLFAGSTGCYSVKHLSKTEKQFLSKKWQIMYLRTGEGHGYRAADTSLLYHIQYNRRKFRSFNGYLLLKCSNGLQFQTFYRMEKEHRMIVKNFRFVSWNKPPNDMRHTTEGAVMAAAVHMNGIYHYNNGDSLLTLTGDTGDTLIRLKACR